MARSSKIIIAKNIKLDKEYKEVLNYSESDMLTLINSKKVAESNNYSFIRETGTISVAFSYSDCLQCNYMAFQNPDYSNKWFFAFIDDVKYINNNTVQIEYTIDVWSTWFSKLTVSSAFVIREHVNNDTVGLHTLPENVETGEYITYNSNEIYNNNCTIVIATTFLPSSASTGQDVSGSFAFGIFSGAKLYAMYDYASATTFINWCAGNGKLDSIQYIFMVPDWILRRSEWAPFTDWVDINGFLDATVINTDLQVPTTLNSYTPKNKKLLCYPYSYFAISNNAGGNMIIKYEDLNIGATTFRIKTQGTVTPGCSIKTYVEQNLEGVTNYDVGLTGAKYPICSWSGDVFTNWLTQNGVNIAVDVAGSLLNMGMSAMSLNPQGVASSTMGIAQTVASVYQHSLAPDPVKGNVNSGDVAFTTDNNVMTYAYRGIKEEYARVIDSYFTRYGYKINQNKIPNITGRRYWNFIQIANSDTLGYGEIPQKFMDEINRIARSGVTIWHSHDNLGDYTLNNIII